MLQPRFVPNYLGVFLICALSQAGCAAALHESRVEEPESQHAFTPSLAASELAAGKWWEALGSQELNGLVDQALEQNYDLVIAANRIQQLDKLVTQANSGFLPTVTASASAGASKVASAMGPVSSEQFSASLAASYEVDLWGRMRANSYALEMDRETAQLGAESAAMTVSAQVVEAWLDVIVQRERRTLLEDQIAIAQTFYELTLMRLKIGVATALDVLQQEQQIEGLQAQLPAIAANETLALNKLALLLGLEPGEVKVAAQPPLPGLLAVGPGLAADLLERRPDLRAKRAEAQAADARLVVAIANRLPSVKFSMSLSTQASSPSDLFEELFWSALMQASGVVFDGTRLASEVERNELAVDQALLAWKQAYLQAIHEVENALVAEQLQLELQQQLQLQYETAEQSLELARQQYLRGVSDYSRVLSALNSVQQLERSLLDSQRSLLSARVQLYRALGGSWSGEAIDALLENSQHVD